MRPRMSVVGERKGFDKVAAKSFPKSILVKNEIPVEENKAKKVIPESPK